MVFNDISNDIEHYEIVLKNNVIHELLEIASILHRNSLEASRVEIQASREAVDELFQYTLPL